MSDIYNYSSLVVGEEYPEFCTYSDTLNLTWRDNIGLVLFVLMNNPSDFEAQQINSSDIAITFTVIDEVCYMSFGFGKSEPMTAPFAPAIYNQFVGRMNLPVIESPNEGLGMLINFFDSSTGTLLSTRVMGLNSVFSKRFIDWADKAQNLPLTKEEYSLSVDFVYSNYSNTDLALKGCTEENIHIYLKEDT